MTATTAMDDSSWDWETEAGRVDIVHGVRVCCMCVNLSTAERSGQSLHGSGRGGLQEPKRLSGERQATNGCASTKALEECISVQLASFSVFSNLSWSSCFFPTCMPLFRTCTTPRRSSALNAGTRRASDLAGRRSRTSCDGNPVSSLSLAKKKLEAAGGGGVEVCRSV